MCYSKIASAVASALLALGSQAFAQTSPISYTQSIQALETAIAAKPLSTNDEKRQFVASSVELARLLPNPDDQIRFLSKAADTRQTADSNLAYELASEAQKRMRFWRAINRTFVSQEAEASLNKLMDVIKPIIELIEPADLIRRFQGMLTDPAKIADLTPDEKTTLFSRGIPRQSLDIRSDSPDALPRELAELLAGRVTGLPALPGLLARAGSVLAMPQIQSGFSDQPSAVATELMAVLFARSLGMDGNDLRPNGDLDKPEYWQLKAEWLGQKHLWRWETIARILQGATSRDAASRAAAVQSATETWSKVQEVHNALAAANAAGADAWSAIPEWIARLSAGAAESLDARDKLPLSPDFRSRGRIRRANLESEFLQARNANNDAEAFRLMQQAKSAELTLLGNTIVDGAVDVVELQKVIGYRGQPKPGEIHLFIELFQTGVTNGSSGSLHAFVVRTPTAIIGATTEFEPARLLTGESTTAGLSGMLTEAIGPLSDSANLHALVAFDGMPRGVNWAEAERVLLDRISGPQGWLVYLPTAAVFAKDSPWTLAPTIRVWYQSLDSADRAKGMAFAATSCDINNFSQGEVNNGLRHGVVKVIMRGVSRPQSELNCGEGWSKLSRSILNGRPASGLDFPMLVASDRKR